MYRRGVDGTLPYCGKCGATQPGVVYVKFEVQRVRGKRAGASRAPPA
jgi:hypothetical protein